MAKWHYKKFLPDPATLKKHPSLKIFGEKLYQPNLWRLNRLSVIRAITIGLFVCFMPIPGHMIIASFLSIIWSANLPLAILTTWVNNPLTMGPMYYLGYKVGITLLGLPEQHLPTHITVKWLFTEAEFIAEPLVIGSVICGFILATLGNILTRLFWRYRTVLHLRRRAKKRSLR